MNFLSGWLGEVLGWLAKMVKRTDVRQGMFPNVEVGIIGALLGGWSFAPLSGTGVINQSDFSLSLLLIVFPGAVILLMIVNLLRRGQVR